MLEAKKKNSIPGINPLLVDVPYTARLTKNLI